MYNSLKQILAMRQLLIFLIIFICTSSVHLYACVIPHTAINSCTKMPMLAQLNAHFANTNLDSDVQVSCATMQLQNALTNWNSLPKHLQKTIRDEVQRPSKKVFTHHTDSEHFRVHYTMERANRPVDAYASKALVDDWLWQLKQYLEMAYEKLIVEQGFDAPPLDAQVGGGLNLYDVYVRDIYGDAIGITFADGPTHGDSVGAISYMFLSSKMSYDESGGSNVMKAASIHEFFHMIQNGYYGSPLAEIAGNQVKTSKTTTIREGTAVWAETLVFEDSPEVENKRYFGYLDISPNIFDSPYEHLILNEERGLSLYAYSSVFFWKYLSEQFGNDIIKKIWEANKVQPDNLTNIQQELWVLEQVLAEYGGLNTIIGDFWAAAALVNPSDDYDVYKQAYSKWTFNSGKAYARYLQMPSLVHRQERPQNLPIKVAWHCSSDKGGRFWDLKPVAGAAFFTIEHYRACENRLRIAPIKATQNVQASDLLAMLIKEDTKHNLVEVVYGEVDLKDESITFTESLWQYDNITLIIYRMTDPIFAQNHRTVTMRYHIMNTPINDCANKPVQAVRKSLIDKAPVNKTKYLKTAVPTFIPTNGLD